MAGEALKADELQHSLRDFADTLGLRVKVTYDEGFLGYRVEAALRPQRIARVISEDTLAGGPAFRQLIVRVLEDMQRKLHDQARLDMDARDVRGRIVHLTNEDKNTLHEMLCAAEKEVLGDFASGPEGLKKSEKYCRLVDRLFR